MTWPSGRAADQDDRAGRRRCCRRASRSPHGHQRELTVDLQLTKDTNLRIDGGSTAVV
ncbi:MAG: hypothetical protein ACREOE_19170 [Gemmatimonadales bacterium]